MLSGEIVDTKINADIINPTVRDTKVLAIQAARARGEYVRSALEPKAPAKLTLRAEHGDNRIALLERQHIITLLKSKKRSAPRDWGSRRSAP